MVKKRVLITGGGGMVGRNLLEHPGIGEFDVLAPRRSELDLRNSQDVQDYLERHKPDIVVHAAGKVGGIAANIREPVNFFLENLDMGRNIVWAARQTGIKHLLNLGSSCMYPRDRTEHLREELVLKGELEPTNEGYALAKVATAKLCEYISREAVDYRYKTMIPCNLYGRYDKFDPSCSHLIPAIIHKLHQAKLNGEDEVEIWGDGEARREFMYAGDLAGAVIEGLNRFDELPSMMNVGLGYDYTINEYYQQAARVVGYSGGFVHDTSRPVGMLRKLVCIDRQKAWGWNAEHDLKTGLTRTYQFYLEGGVR
jgi:GDP-L-fucose synthase